MLVTVLQKCSSHVEKVHPKGKSVVCITFWGVISTGIFAGRSFLDIKTMFE